MCNCIEEVNEQLKQYNSELELTIPLKIGVNRRIILSTVKIDPKKKGKSITITASFCPFCGALEAQEQEVGK